MGLVTCPDCAKEVSDQAAACIHCGRPLSADVVQKPAAGSAEAAKTGRQRSKLRNDLGNAVGLVGFAAAVVIGIASGSLAIGFVLAIAAIGLGLWIAYGS